jgi:hypothetical protein
MRNTAYREHFGWTVDDRENTPHLVLGQNMVGLAVPRASGGAVLEYLLHQEIRGPVLEFDMGTWVFLADSNGLVLNPADLPAGVRFLSCGVALPMPLSPRSTSVRWIVAPDVRQRWLPSLAAVVAAIRASAARIA